MTPRKLRFVTAASLFDGHDASINIMRRLLQSKGVEVIHLGHNRSALEVVEAALSEDAHAIALSSYQGGHMEYFTYVRELLDKNGGQAVRIFGGGGGVITPPEIQELHKRGITRIYHPNDGTSLGLNGIIDDMIQKCDYSTLEGINFKDWANKKLASYDMAKVITYIEDKRELPFELNPKNIPVLGITGTGGAGKSSLIDELLLRFHRYYCDKKIALVSVDPTKKKNQGALLGDRIRLGSASYKNFYIRSLATRDSANELSPEIKKVVEFLKTQDFDLILVETSGIGQASDEITKVANQTLYVMTPEFGAATQLEKIEMLEAADFIAVNKYEKPRSEDALRDVRKQYRRNKQLFANHPGSPTDEELPVFGTMASKFNDLGVNALFKSLIESLKFPHNQELDKIESQKACEKKQAIIPASRINYLRDISDVVRSYNKKTQELVQKLRNYESLQEVSKIIKDNKDILDKKENLEKELKDKLKIISDYDGIIEQI
jgi:isobutyryl-CoA mutase